MSNVYRFIYDSEFAEGFGQHPEASTVKARHYFEDGITWVPILWQFCKFLESTGYVGVCDRVVIKDPYGIEQDNHLFETIGPNELIVDMSINDPLDNEDKDAQ